MPTDLMGPGLLKLDLSAFADPGSEVSVESKGDTWWEARWHEDGTERCVEVQVDGETPVATRLENGELLSYRAFLSGASMGNLRALARNTLHVLDPVDPFIPPVAQLEGEANSQSDGMELLLEAALPLDGRTAVVFVAADAGVGKTVLLRQTVRKQAERYLKGENPSLWLYVDAQARRLAALDEALASELDRLRARFPFDAISPLVRTGAVTLVVDGFDELLGSVGAYDEAFNSLWDFISTLQGGGTIVAAARSAYYEQEFLSRVGPRSPRSGRGDRWHLRPLRLREWDQDQIVQYVELLARLEQRLPGTHAEAVSQVVSALSSGELASVGGKPFFVARTTELVLTGDLQEATGANTLLDRLVNAYLERDSQKLRGPNKQPLLTAGGLRSFFDELAFEMWRQESRELSRVTLREIASLVGELEFLDEDGIRELAARAPYFAMLRQGSLQGSVGWEHDVYFAYFLASPLSEALEKGEPRRLGRILRRGRLPEDAALLAGRIVRSGSTPGADILSLLVSTASDETIDAEQVRRNAGLLAGGWFAGCVNSDLEIRDLTVGDISLQGASFDRCKLTNMEFAGTDFSIAHFANCSALGGVFLNRVIVSPSSTRLDIIGLPVSAFFGLVVRDDTGDRLLYSPSDIREVLNYCGLPSAAPRIHLREVDSDTLRLLEKLCRFYSRSNVVVEGVDNDSTTLTSDPAWIGLRSALIDSGVVSVDSRRQHSGQNKVFLERMVRPQEIMAGLDVSAEIPDVVRAFWNLLENR